MSYDDHPIVILGRRPNKCKQDWNAHANARRQQYDHDDQPIVIFGRRSNIMISKIHARFERSQLCDRHETRLHGRRPQIATLGPSLMTVCIPIIILRTCDPTHLLVSPLRLSLQCGTCGCVIIVTLLLLPVSPLSHRVCSLTQSASVALTPSSFPPRGSCKMAPTATVRLHILRTMAERHRL